MVIKEIFSQIYRINGRLSTKNLNPGVSVYDEKLIREGRDEYREWDLFRSKLAGAIAKGLNEVPLKENSFVLYLGASTGTTVSHVSDIVGINGLVVAVEISSVCMPPLIHLAEQRGNIVPIIEDSNHPERYSDVPKVDLVYQDISQRNQVEILLKNIKAFLKPDGYYMFCVKSQSIDVTKKPRQVYDEVIKELSKHTTVIQTLQLDPYDKHHMFIFGKI
ncbi:fibrillarin-like rRNA/tRNA 2'-O-methyltransferase [Candidatus Micrarchaeota archaeon]|nr:fibrillarin-like rRNA/tRNA 2'-O-methyltransferase [Candidatus Micrarchaeota archaeon]